VALFNNAEKPAEVAINFSDLGISGTQKVRDLWQRKDLGSFDSKFSATVLGHGAVLVKVGKAK
jgi:alpha-galactosidase